MKGENIKNKMDFYTQMDSFFNFNEYVDGAAGVPSLDVLWDVMTCGAGLNCELHWKDSDVSKVNLGDDYFYKIIDTLREVEEYQENLCVKYRQFKDDEPFKFFLE